MTQKKQTADPGQRVRSLKPRLNIRQEIRRLKVNPLLPLLTELAPREQLPLVYDDFGRCWEAYELYALSVERFYRALSLGARWRNGAYYARKYRMKYSPNERRVADRFRDVRRFLVLDFFNCLIHARILMDRTVGVARYFLPAADRPSLTSFSDHKRFFLRRKSAYGSFDDYAEYFRAKTDWFDQLKDVRDRILVHQGPRHWRYFGYPLGGPDLELVIGHPKDQEKVFAQFDVTVVSIRDLARDVDTFLRWFAERGIRAHRKAGGLRDSQGS